MLLSIKENNTFFVYYKNKDFIRLLEKFIFSRRKKKREAYTNSVYEIIELIDKNFIKTNEKPFIFLKLDEQKFFGLNNSNSVIFFKVLFNGEIVWIDSHYLKVLIENKTYWVDKRDLVKI